MSYSGKYNGTYASNYNGAYGAWIQELKRVFIDLNGADAYYELAQPITFAGDFEVECEFSTTNTTHSMRLLSTSDSELDGIQIYVTGATGVLSVKLEVSGVATFLNTAISTVNDGGLHTAKLRKSGVTFYLSVDGGAEVSSHNDAD